MLYSKLLHHREMDWSLGLMICVYDTITADNQICVSSKQTSCSRAFFQCRGHSTYLCNYEVGHNCLLQELQQCKIPKPLMTEDSGCFLHGHTPLSWL